MRRVRKHVITLILMNRNNLLKSCRLVDQLIKHPSFELKSVSIDTSKQLSHEFSSRVNNSMNYRFNDVFTDGMTFPSKSGKLFFASILGVGGMFLFNFATDNNPQTFQRTLHYHLPFSALMISLWGGAYVGMEVARFGQGNPNYRLLGGAPRLAVGCTLLGIGSLNLFESMYDPWRGYRTLGVSYLSLILIDAIYHKMKMTPSFYFPWRCGFNVLMLGSFLFAYSKGHQIENSAEEILMKAAVDARNMKETEAWEVPAWMKKTMMLPIPSENVKDNTDKQLNK